MATESKIAKAKKGVERALETLRDLMGQFERFGDEPEVGTVIRFAKRFNGGGKTYRYAALRTRVGWFTTGYGTGVSSIKLNRSGGMKWDDLVEFIGDSRAWVTTEWREVPTLNPDVKPDNSALLDTLTNELTKFDTDANVADAHAFAEKMVNLIMTSQDDVTAEDGETTAPRARSFLDDYR